MTASRLGALLFLTTGLSAGVIAQAQQPPPASKPTAAALHSPAAPAKPIEAQPASAQLPAGPSAQFLRDARNAGFKPTQVRGALMFCRIATELGSNFPVRTCYNEQQTKVKIAEYQEQRNQLRQGRFIAPMCAANSRSC